MLLARLDEIKYFFTSYWLFPHMNENFQVTYIFTRDLRMFMWLASQYGSDRPNKSIINQEAFLFSPPWIDHWDYFSTVSCCSTAGRQHSQKLFTFEWKSFRNQILITSWSADHLGSEVRTWTLSQQPETILNLSGGNHCGRGGGGRSSIYMWCCINKQCVEGFAAHGR